jgi:hypothetical protein
VKTSNFTIIQPADLFGNETWTLTEKSTARLMSWERKILRRIYGITWRIRSNRELESLYNGADIVAKIKPRRIDWLGEQQGTTKNSEWQT